MATALLAHLLVSLLSAPSGSRPSLPPSFLFLPDGFLDAQQSQLILDAVAGVAARKLVHTSYNRHGGAHRSADRPMGGILVLPPHERRVPVVDGMRLHFDQAIGLPFPLHSRLRSSALSSDLQVAIRISAGPRPRLSTCPLGPSHAVPSLFLSSFAAASALCCPCCTLLLHSAPPASATSCPQQRPSTLGRTPWSHRDPLSGWHTALIPLRSTARHCASLRGQRVAVHSLASPLHGVRFAHRSRSYLYLDVLMCIYVLYSTVSSLLSKNGIKNIGPRESPAYASSLCRRWAPTAS